MAISLNKSKKHILVMITLFVVLIIAIGILACIIRPLYTKLLFTPLATENFFPEYATSDSDYLKQEYGSLWFECTENEYVNMYSFSLDFTTEVDLQIYDTTAECNDGFFIETDFENGIYITNTDDFKVYVSEKNFNLLQLTTEQCMLVQNGTNLYYITKYDFSFSQNDFKNSIMRMEKKQSDYGSMIEP